MKKIITTFCFCITFFVSSADTSQMSAWIDSFRVMSANFEAAVYDSSSCENLDSLHEGIMSIKENIIREHLIYTKNFCLKKEYSLEDIREYEKEEKLFSDFLIELMNYRSLREFALSRNHVIVTGQ